MAIVIASRPCLAMSFASLCAALCQPALAYVRDHQTGDSRPLRLASSFVTMHFGGTVPAGVAKADVVRVARDAAEAWNAVSCSSVQITVVEDGNSKAVVENDRVFRIMFRSDAWARNGTAESGNEYDSGMLAVTSIFVGNSRSTKTAVIQDADIEINAVNYRWQTSDLVSGDSQHAPSLRATLMHEFGHVLGLQHTCAERRGDQLLDDKGAPRPLCSDPTARPLRQTLMYPNFRHSEPMCLRRASLSRDEVRAICAIYPRRR